MEFNNIDVILSNIYIESLSTKFLDKPRIFEI
jgi:hypothetical protein